METSIFHFGDLIQLSIAIHIAYIKGDALADFHK